MRITEPLEQILKVLLWAHFQCSRPIQDISILNTLNICKHGTDNVTATMLIAISSNFITKIN